MTCISLLQVEKKMPLRNTYRSIQESFENMTHKNNFVQFFFEFFAPAFEVNFYLKSIYLFIYLVFIYFLFYHFIFSIIFSTTDFEKYTDDHINIRTSTRFV